MPDRERYGWLADTGMGRYELKFMSAYSIPVCLIPTKVGVTHVRDITWARPFSLSAIASQVAWKLAAIIVNSRCAIVGNRS